VVLKLLLEHEGYEVLTADNGNSGLDVFASQAIDLVILDYRMPEPNGGIVAAKMRELRPDIPIIMLSAYLQPPQEVNGLINAYVTKGENPRVLLERIHSLLKLT